MKQANAWRYFGPARSLIRCHVPDYYIPRQRRVDERAISFHSIRYKRLCAMVDMLRRYRRMTPFKSGSVNIFSE